MLIGIMLIFGMTSCNTKAEDDPDYVVSSNVAVSNFYLKRDGKLLEGMDSVFFSIDLKKRIIFNADSLPKGIDVRKLIPVITMPGKASSMILTMTGGTYRTGEVDYIKNPTDSIDFTGDVVLSVVAEDGVSKCDYMIKVNVHKMAPDSLWWDQLAVAELPSRLPSPIRQRTVEFGGKVVTFVAENDGTFTKSYTDNPTAGEWVQQKVEFGFTPDLRSIAATSDKYYVLSNEGMLYESVDGASWKSTEQQWVAILGGYGERLLGIESAEDGLRHIEYPEGGGESVDSEFPIKGYSGFKTYSNKWITTPIGLLTGGVNQSGTYTGATWGYDGDKWVKLSSNPAPAVDGGTMIPYYMYQKNSGLYASDMYNVWMFVGGVMADGTFNKKMYMTYDNGVNWTVCGEMMQLPDYIPGMKSMDSVVVNTSMEGNFEPKGWTTKSSKKLPGWYRVKYEIDGYNVKWECPYIYLMGGEDAEGILYNTIWKGVLNRLTFVPII